MKVTKLIKRSVAEGHLSKVDVANAAIELLPNQGGSGIKKESRDEFVKTMRAVVRDPHVQISDAAREGLKTITSELSYDRSSKAYGVGLDAARVFSILDIRLSSKGLSPKAEGAARRVEHLRTEAGELRDQIDELVRERGELNVSRHDSQRERLEFVETRLDRLCDRLAVVDEELGS